MVNFHFRQKLQIVEWNRAEKLIVFVRWNVREMAEPTKRTTNNSTSKARKSKNDIIRSKVGTYLKQQSYSVSEWKVVLIEILKKFYAEFMFDVHLTSTNLIHTWNVCCMFTYLCLFVVLIMKILGVLFIFQMNEKFRKSDLALTQTTDQYEFDTMIVEDSARAMSFLYSNVLCLSNNQSQVELQFSK